MLERIVMLFIVALLLDALGIGVASFRIAGGLVLLIVSMKMILEEGPARHKTDGGGPSGRPTDVAVFPLAMPLIVGRGRS